MLGAPGMERAREVLRGVFGHEDFIGRQAEVVGEALGGRDVLAIMPTGGGKSLCYQIPAIVREGTGVVVSPLIALMKDQVDALLQNGVKAGFMNSTQTAKQYAEVRAKFDGGELDLLYVSPERLLTESSLQMLHSRADKLALFAIDEAHCISQWGHDFRREYLQLGKLAAEFPNVPRLALTATADEKTRREIIDKLRMTKAKQILASFDRPNIRYAVRLKTLGSVKKQFLEFYRNNHDGESGIVYCMSRKNTEKAAEFLEEHGIRALPYHAGMNKGEREKCQDAFTREDGVVVCATIAFGMGIDKPDVRFVAHFDLPKHVEGYYQETGRAGRDGLPSDAVLYYGAGDVRFIRDLIEQSDASETVKNRERGKLNELINICETVKCRRAAILACLGEVYNAPCDNCDNCINPPEQWDATTEVQKFLSCVARTEQRFGAGYVVDVLRGKDDDRIARFGHDKVSTFGIGADVPKMEWHSLARQLIAAEKVAVEGEYGVLKLNEESWNILKGGEKVFLRKDPSRREKRERKAPHERAEVADLNEAQLALYDEIREERNQLAKAQNIMPYNIFNNKTAKDLAVKIPRTEAEFAAIDGIGERKASRYFRSFSRLLEKAGGAF